LSRSGKLFGKLLMIGGKLYGGCCWIGRMA